MEVIYAVSCVQSVAIIPNIVPCVLLYAHY